MLATVTMSATALRARCRVAVIGDVHGAWDSRDLEALRLLAPDVVLAVGDFDNEEPAIVRSVADACDAAILGNHDAWRSVRNGRVSAELRASVEALGGRDAGFNRLELRPDDGRALAVVGGRPLSFGGSSVTPGAWKLLSALYGVASLEESRDCLTDLLLRDPSGDTIVLAHSGPSGLGATASSICGRDFKRPALDFGDDDLRDALETAAACGARVPLVVFGHMHAELMLGGRRTMVVRRAGTVFVNAAEVPRHRADGTAHFTLVELEDGEVREVAGLWVGAEGIAQREVLYAANALEPDPSPT